MKDFFFPTVLLAGIFSRDSSKFDRGRLCTYLRYSSGEADPLSGFAVRSESGGHVGVGGRREGIEPTTPRAPRFVSQLPTAGFLINFPAFLTTKHRPLTEISA